MENLNNSNTEKNVSNLYKMPNLKEGKTSYNGPKTIKLQKKFYLMYTIIFVVGITPMLLKAINIPVPGKIAAAFMGLLFPGAGLIASSNVLGIILGIILAYFAFTIAFMRNTKAGDKSWLLVSWIIGIVGGLIADDTFHFLGAICTIVIECCIILYFYQDDKKYHKNEDKLKSKREKYTEIENEYQQIISKKRQKSEELTDEQLKTVRLIFDITVQNIGDFTGIEMPKWSSNEFRYQMCYAGYGLLMMQRRFTPNFRGYMQHSLQYIIESFTTAQSCGYWITETLGGHGSFDFDPISPRHHDNIMLKGWIAPIITGYHAVTGDNKYNKSGALKFKPFKKFSKQTFDYSVDDIVKIIVNDWKNNVLGLIPCEPHLVFPICNTYPMIGIEIYDNDFDTHYASSIYSNYIQDLCNEFLEKGGNIAQRRTSLNGLNWYPTRNFELDNDLFVLPMMNAIYPGLAKRNWMYLRKENLSILDNGEALFRGEKINKVFNFNNPRSKAGLILGIMQQCAAEFGDWEMYDALIKSEKMYAPTTKNPLVLEYKGLNFVNSVSMAVSKWAQQDDWYYLAHSKVTDAEKKGPILEKCKYPDVLVAKAKSNGNDLDLVIRNGLEAKTVELHLAQLASNTEYIDKLSQKIIFKSDKNGKAFLKIYLDGRKHLHIVKNNA